MVARLLKVIQVSPSWTNFVFGKFSTFIVGVPATFVENDKE